MYPPRGLNLIAPLAADRRAPIPAAAAIRERLKAAVNQGWGEGNASALFNAREQQAGVTVGVTP